MWICPSTPDWISINLPILTYDHTAAHSLVKTLRSSDASINCVMGIGKYATKFPVVFMYGTPPTRVDSMRWQADSCSYPVCLTGAPVDIGFPAVFDWSYTYLPLLSSPVSQIIGERTQRHFMHRYSTGSHLSNAGLLPLEMNGACRPATQDLILDCVPGPHLAASQCRDEALEHGQIWIMIGVLH